MYLSKYCLYFESCREHYYSNTVINKQHVFLLLWVKCAIELLLDSILLTFESRVEEFCLTSPIVWLYWQFNLASLILKYWHLSHCKNFRKTAIPAILLLIFLLLPGLHIATKLLLAIQKHIFSHHLQMWSVYDTRPCSWIYSSLSPSCWTHSD